MATKLKPQGSRCKRFEIWTKVAKLPKPQGPKWQFTLKKISKFEFFYIFIIAPKHLFKSIVVNMPTYLLNGSFHVNSFIKYVVFRLTCFNKKNVVLTDSKLDYYHVVLQIMSQITIPT
ncbi:hypothetical protein Hanom_Chr11g01039501 [Helianthus anomalus]